MAARLPHFRRVLGRVLGRFSKAQRLIAATVVVTLTASGATVLLAGGGTAEPTSSAARDAIASLSPEASPTTSTSGVDGEASGDEQTQSLMAPGGSADDMSPLGALLRTGTTLTAGGHSRPGHAEDAPVAGGPGAPTPSAPAPAPPTTSPPTTAPPEPAPSEPSPAPTPRPGLDDLLDPPKP